MDLLLKGLNDMMKDEVKIGHRYIAKVAGKITIIKITNPAFRGWVAKSCSTGRRIIVRSAQRLRRSVEEEEFNRWSWRLHYARNNFKPDPEPNLTLETKETP